MIDPRTVAASYVRTLLEVVESRGIARDVMLHGLPIDEARLANPNERVSLGVTIRLWERGLEATHDKGLGLAVGMHARPSTFHVLGHAAMSCASLGDALDVMLRYQRLVSEAGVLSVEHAPLRTVITYRPHLGLALLPVQVEGILAGVIGQARFLAGRMIKPLRVAFTHGRFADEGAYIAAFGCAPTFESEATLLELSTKDLASPLPQPDAAMKEVCCRMADAALEALPPIGYVSGFAHQWLRVRPAGAVRIDDLARALATSPRSLQRQLGDEGTSFSALVDDARRASAHAMLDAGKTLDVTARELGYHDASSLSRALRRWSGGKAKRRARG